MSIEIVIDPNVRSAGNRTYAGFEDVRGGFVEDLAPGDLVTVLEEESDVIGEAFVAEISEPNQLIYLDVYWHTLRPRPQVQSVLLSGWPRALVRATLTSTPGSLALGAGVTSSGGVDSVLSRAG
jgi:hypothetical protein